MRFSRADEPQIISALRVFFEVIWLILRLDFEIVKALFRFALPQEPKDVTEDIVLVSVNIYTYRLIECSTFVYSVQCTDILKRRRSIALVNQLKVNFII